MKSINSVLILIIISSLTLNAQQCKVYGKKKPEDDSLFGKFKGKVYDYKYSALSKILLDVKLDKENSKCPPTHPLIISLINNSSSDIVDFTFRVGGWEQKTGKFIEAHTHKSEDKNIIIKANTIYSLCSKIPNELWSYNKPSINPSPYERLMGPAKDRVTKRYSLDEIDFGIVKDSCFINFRKFTDKLF